MPQVEDLNRKVSGLKNELDRTARKLAKTKSVANVGRALIKAQTDSSGSDPVDWKDEWATASAVIHAWLPRWDHYHRSGPFELASLPTHAAKALWADLEENVVRFSKHFPDVCIELPSGKALAELISRELAVMDRSNADLEGEYRQLKEAYQELLDQRPAGVSGGVGLALRPTPSQSRGKGAGHLPTGAAALSAHFPVTADLLNLQRVLHLTDEQMSILQAFLDSQFAALAQSAGMEPSAIRAVSSVGSAGDVSDMIKEQDQVRKAAAILQPMLASIRRARVADGADSLDDAVDVEAEAKSEAAAQSVIAQFKGKNLSEHSLNEATAACLEKLLRLLGVPASELGAVPEKHRAEGLAHLLLLQGQQARSESSNSIRDGLLRLPLLALALTLAGPISSGSSESAVRLLAEVARQQVRIDELVRGQLKRVADQKVPTFAGVDEVIVDKDGGRYSTVRTSSVVGALHEALTSLDIIKKGSELPLGLVECAQLLAHAKVETARAVAAAADGLVLDAVRLAPQIGKGDTTAGVELGRRFAARARRLDQAAQIRRLQNQLSTAGTDLHDPGINQEVKTALLRAWLITSATGLSSKDAGLITAWDAQAAAAALAQLDLFPEVVYDELAIVCFDLSPAISNGDNTATCQLLAAYRAFATKKHELYMRVIQTSGLDFQLPQVTGALHRIICRELVNVGAIQSEDDTSVAQLSVTEAAEKLKAFLPSGGRARKEMTARLSDRSVAELLPAVIGGENHALMSLLAFGIASLDREDEKKLLEAGGVGIGIGWLHGWEVELLAREAIERSLPPGASRTQMTATAAAQLLLEGTEKAPLVGNDNRINLIRTLLPELAIGRWSAICEVALAEAHDEHFRERRLWESKLASVNVMHIDAHQNALALSVVNATRAAGIPDSDLTGASKGSSGVLALAQRLAAELPLPYLNSLEDPALNAVLEHVHALAGGSEIAFRTLLVEYYASRQGVIDRIRRKREYHARGSASVFLTETVDETAESEADRCCTDRVQRLGAVHMAHRVRKLLLAALADTSSGTHPPFAPPEEHDRYRQPNSTLHPPILPPSLLSTVWPPSQVRYAPAYRSDPACTQQRSVEELCTPCICAPSIHRARGTPRAAALGERRSAITD